MSRNALNNKQPERKTYYFLVAGTVFFVTGENPEEPVSLPMNAIITSETGQLPVSKLGEAQRGLAQACADKLGPTVEMHLADVQVVNISKLGHMTPSEFYDLKTQPDEPEDTAPAKVAQ